MSATFLYRQHIDLGAKMTNFCGWDVPIRYSSQIQEHQAVREHCGLFDVSHMLAIDITGTDARLLLRRIYSNDVAKSTDPGSALYGCMLNESGQVIDDLICYVIHEEHYRIVVNAGCREKDITWIRSQAAGTDVHITMLDTMGIIALQGPHALTTLVTICPQLSGVKHLKTMQGGFFDNVFIARSGYTGEDGVEIIGNEDRIRQCWNSLIAAEVQPCGLGARDSLRLEAGLCLYGHELSESITPLEAGIGWCVDWSDPDREFIGKQSLLQQKETGRARKLVGLMLQDKGVMRDEQALITNHGTALGIITSGGYSPVLHTSIALALIDAHYTDTTCKVDMNKRQVAANITGTVFVRTKKTV